MTELPKTFPSTGTMFPYATGDSFAGSRIAKLGRSSDRVTLELDDGRTATYTDQYETQENWKLISEN